MNNNYIEIINVDKYFKNDHALKRVNVVFSKSKIHGIIGRNGSGKTVLFKCICGFMPVSNGIIKVNSQIIGRDIDIPSKVGIIIEAPGFLPQFSGFKNLKFLALINNKISDNDIKKAIELVGLDPNSSKKVGKYSLGMRQRLGIAQAIMEDPDLIILDEPMNGLDKFGVCDIRKLLISLKEKGKTLLIASHSNEDIEVLCDTVHEMDAGIINRIK